MTPLPILLARVRSSLAEITVDNMDDLTMYRELQKASVYIASIQETNAVPAEVDSAMVCLAAY